MNLMDTLFNLLQILMDAGLILLCCQTVFKEREHWGRKDFLLFPVITLFFMAARAGMTVGSPSGPLFAKEGYEVAPSNLSLIHIWTRAIPACLSPARTAASRPT